jgi:hypothetical protein
MAIDPDADWQNSIGAANWEEIKLQNVILSLVDECKDANWEHPTVHDFTILRNVSQCRNLRNKKSRLRGLTDLLEKNNCSGRETAVKAAVW